MMLLHALLETVHGIGPPTLLNSHWLGYTLKLLMT